MNTNESWTVIPNNVLERLYNGYLSKPAIKLYLLLRRYKNSKTGKCWVSSRKIKRIMTISDRDISPAKQELLDMGLITEIKHLGRNSEIIFND